MKYRFATTAIHAGMSPEAVTGAVMTPIYQNSTYAQIKPGQPIGNYEYSRTDNPTRNALEVNLAALEEGVGAVTFSSGCAALCAILHLFKQGDHILINDDVYGGTYRIFENVFKQFGINYNQVDMNNIDEVKSNILPNTKLIWCETPSNPMLKIYNIKALKNLIEEINPSILLAIDNTFATPYLQQPLKLGADIVSHSSTKYLGGHSDVVGGALVIKDEVLFKKIKYVQNAVGAVPGPMDCFLLIRSLKTLKVRMDQHCKNALSIAHFLTQHKRVKHVYYPGLTHHTQHKLAKAQMRDYGGMISVALDLSTNQINTFLSHLKIFTLAESLGGVESLIEHPATMTHAGIPHDQRQILGIVDGLVRISVGIEDSDDLINDINTALSLC